MKNIVDKGLIVVNKESDMTSRDVINKLNRIFNMKRVGHTGTLDPMAKGVLVVAFGRYTKLVDYITSYDKEYIATVKLGIITDTLDITGNVLKEESYVIDKLEIERVLKSFVGIYIQETPIYSAVKVNGKKLYEYARSGEYVELPKRKVEILDIELLEVLEDGFKFRVIVSKGTYIRALINDISKLLGTVGVMSDLIRTKQGIFNIEDSYKLSDIENNIYNILLLSNLGIYKQVILTDEEYFKVKNGVMINKDIPDEEYLLMYENKEIALYHFKSGNGKINVMLELRN